MRKQHTIPGQEAVQKEISQVRDEIKECEARKKIVATAIMSVDMSAGVA